MAAGARSKPRKAARAAGEKWYFTGVPCKHGHLSKRFSSCGACFECSSSINQSTIEFREYKRRHYLANKTAHLERGKLWKAANPEKSREIKIRWRKSNPEKIRASALSRTKHAIGSISAADIAEIIERQRGRCACCQNRAKLEMDHIFPVFLGGKTERGNLQGLCRTCNARKGAKHPADFNRSIGLLL
jgi:5-methylcytosine-specific restriction endonuclease McrA